MSIVDRLKTGFPPITVNGESHVEKVVERLEMLDALFRSAILEVFATYQKAVVPVIENHNEFVNILKIARPESFKTGLRMVYDEFVKQDADLLADLIIDIEQAEEDQ